MPQTAASHLELFCLLRGISSKLRYNIEITPEAPKIHSGLAQMIMIDESICHIWVQILYPDFTSERCPYRKICIGIQDMRLDLMKSLVGDNVSTERLKKSRFMS